jgi:hypothetical protein
VLLTYRGDRRLCVEPEQTFQKLSSRRSSPLCTIIALRTAYIARFAKDWTDISSILQADPMRNAVCCLFTASAFLDESSDRPGFVDVSLPSQVLLLGMTGVVVSYHTEVAIALNHWLRLI